MTRAAIYARVSSAAQRERQTITGQLLALRPYVAAQGWTLVGEYVDDGRSAATGRLSEREGWARLVADVAAGRIDVVAVVDVDRLTRTDDLAERAQILGPLQRAGVRIVTPSGEHDLRTMLGELYVTIQAMVGAEENRKRAQRIVRGKVRAIAEGRKPAGPTPYGTASSPTAGATAAPRRSSALPSSTHACGPPSCASWTTPASRSSSSGARPPALATPRRGRPTPPPTAPGSSAWTGSSAATSLATSPGRPLYTRVVVYRDDALRIERLASERAIDTAAVVAGLLAEKEEP